MKSYNLLVTRNDKRSIQNGMLILLERVLEETNIIDTLTLEVSNVEEGKLINIKVNKE